MDTTYWGRRFGLMVIRDAVRGRVLWRKYVTHETIADYMEGVNWLKSKGFKIYGAVIDGMKGLSKALYPIPVQLCQFHQMLIVRRYITQDPDIEASKALLNLVNDITKMDKESFMGAFNEWYDKYQDVLNERVHDKRIKKRTRPLCVRNCAVHTSVSSETCRFFGLSMTVRNWVCRIPTMPWKGYSLS